MPRRDEENGQPSRSALKRAAREVEHLARRLVELPASELGRVPADADLRREIDLARATRGHGARDRQIRHLAALLRRREEETAALQDFLADAEGGRLRDAEAFHRLEELRERLCDPGRFPEALAEAKSAWSALDADAVARLARAVHATDDRRARREIFRLLRAASEKSS